VLLCLEIGLSAEQAERFRQQLRRVLGGSETAGELWRLGVAAAYLQRLRVAFANAAARAQAHTERAREVLSPAQLVRFFAWTERSRGLLSESVEQVIVMPAAAAATAAATATATATATAPAPAEREPGDSAMELETS